MKLKVKLTLEEATKAQKWSRVTALLFLTSLLDGVGGQLQAPAVLLPGKTRYPLYKKLVGPQGRTGRVRKFLPPPGFDSRTVQSVESGYTD
jgi:hypothetical protein